MERYRVVAFETVFPIWDDHVERRGGGVAFFALDVGDWSERVAELVRLRFLHGTVRSAEIGVATLDPAVLEQFCQRLPGGFWQGGDRP
jgi:hypothetical protein